GYHLISSNQTVKAEEGDDVILKCHLQPSINLQKYIFDVKRHDLKGNNGPSSNDIVFVYGREEVNQVEQLDQYRSRTSIISEDLSRGILTLIISSVQLRDSGKYKMFVPELKTFCFINLTVDAQKLDWKTVIYIVVPVVGVLVAVAVLCFLKKRGRIPLTDISSDAQKLDWKTVIYIVVPVGVLVAVAVLCFLKKRGRIQICKKKNRVARQEADSLEMENLSAQPAEV
ncbi:hypothetical protein L3Q82_020052, partial [Scortum barcoo]